LSRCGGHGKQGLKSFQAHLAGGEARHAATTPVLLRTMSASHPRHGPRSPACASLVWHMSLLHTGAMFEKKAQAEAKILDDEGPGNVVDRDIHGVDWDHHKYIVEVHPPGQDPFRC
jgi:hypothetical protein